MSNDYAYLIENQSNILSEPERKYSFLTERHLQAIWFEQKYFTELKTSEGLPIKVLSSGIWNAEKGPDFLKAHLKIGEQELHGDVEIHLLDDGWRLHHHHQNPTYDNVILHLSLWAPKIPKPLETSHHKIIPRVYLDPHLSIPHSKILNYIDLDLYPYKKFIGGGRCARTLFNTLSNEKIEELFQSAADWRLTQKQKYLETHFSHSSAQLGAGIAMALGYKNNTHTFVKLYTALQNFASSTKTDLDLLAYVMGACGFFSEKYQKRWSLSQHYQKLLVRYQELGVDHSSTFPIVLSQVRPFNHPIRRLVYLSKLLSQDSLEVLYQTLSNHWQQSWSHLEPSKLRIQLQDLLPNYEDPYWNSHYLFEETKRDECLPLVGESLKNEMLVNTVLPLLKKGIDSRGDFEEIHAFQLFYLSFPLAKTGKTHYLIHRFFGDSPKSSLMNNACHEQGAYQLHRDFCVHYEASCEGCPFVDRFKKIAS